MLDGKGLDMGMLFFALFNPCPAKFIPICAAGGRKLFGERGLGD